PSPIRPLPQPTSRTTSPSPILAPAKTRPEIRACRSAASATREESPPWLRSRTQSAKRSRSAANVTCHHLRVEQALPRQVENDRVVVANSAKALQRRAWRRSSQRVSALQADLHHPLAADTCRKPELDLRVQRARSPHRNAVRGHTCMEIV